MVKGTVLAVGACALLVACGRSRRDERTPASDGGTAGSSTSGAGGSGPRAGGGTGARESGGTGLMAGAAATHAGRASGGRASGGRAGAPGDGGAPPAAGGVTGES